MRNLDQFRGCLIGGAAGDSLGYAVEFMREDTIFAKYGKGGITEYQLTDGKALISDDTQMTLFTATGLIHGITRGFLKGIPADLMHDIAGNYLAWYRTQTEKYPLHGGKTDSWLLNVPELFARRAPGTTCLAALRAGGNDEDESNNSKGCGAVMRMAPVGLCFSDWPGMHSAADLAARAGFMTHGHVLGWMSAAVFAVIIQGICQDGLSVREAVKKALGDLEDFNWSVYAPAKAKHREKLRGILLQALELADEEMPDTDAIHLLGEGWVGEETLAIAVYCAAKYEDDFDKALIAAVNHNGDSDSTGAVTGNILGAKLGLQGIPEKYLEHLELKDVILQVADDLWRACGAGEDPTHDPGWIEKYSDCTWHMPG